MKNSYLFLALLLFLVPAVPVPGQQNMMETEIKGNWQFKASDDAEWLPATVPGCVHTDLLDNGKIKDPFYRTNERDIQWIDKKDWEYRTTLTVDKALMHKDRIELDFKGLDTYAEVFLNEKPVLKADNMFREWRVDVKPFLRQGNNTLRVLLRSPVTEGLKKHNAQGYIIPVSDNDQSVVGGLGDKKVSIYTRKAGYHFGWDWGPRFVTSGIWRPVKLRAWNTAIIRDVFIQQKELTNEQAALAAAVEVEALRPGKAELQVLINGIPAAAEAVALRAGENKLSVDFSIAQPRRWWPNGLGEAYRYQIEVRLVAKGKQVLSGKTVPTGLRTIEVVQQPDAKGKSFFFRVNGHPVFMKGANYIPQDNFLNRVTAERYEHILQSAKDANMNMIRIWGGGVYEEDLFYEKCDEKGLLVWQDFMFACAMFPGDEAFLNNVRQEAIDNIRRLRNHPSMALWCGNNENLSAWYGWGWGKQAEEKQGKAVADALWKAYDDLYHKLLPQVVAEFDPGRFYWSSSPSAGANQPENWVAGDVHYWGVWWGQEPFSRYQELIPRFMSEFGFQSFPELSTIRKFAEPEDYDIFSEVMKAHQRSSIGNGTIANYMDRDYQKPKDFPSFLYVGQVLQAEGIRTGIEVHRRNMPYCMGSLYWQIDDCWPVASWSSIDYYGRWKALHYFAKKAFREVLVSPVVENNEVQVYLVSDRLKPASVQLKLRLMDFLGKTIWEKDQTVEIPANSSSIFFKAPVTGLLGNTPPNSVLLHAEVVEGGTVLTDNILYFAPPKDLDLPHKPVSMETENIGVNEYRMRISSDGLQKNMCLNPAGEEEVVLSDNYFDLLPGRPAEITFKTKRPVDEQFINKLMPITLTLSSVHYESTVEE